MNTMREQKSSPTSLSIRRIRSFLDHVNRFVRQNKLICDKEHMLVAVSGGCDSMALLRYLEMIVNRRKLRLTVIHINHCLRGKESDQDEKFVRRYCAQRKIRCLVQKISIERGVRPPSEESLRNKR